MKPGVLTSILYEKADGTETERDIIAVDVPRDYIRAIDTTDLIHSDVEELKGLVGEYQEYLTNVRKTIVSFSDWLEQTGNDNYEIEWRTFKLGRILEEHETDC